MGTLFNILLQVVIVNVVLMVFNLIPVPPLDGFGIITEIFNLREKSFYYTLYNYGFPILMILLIVGVVDKILKSDGKRRLCTLAAVYYFIELEFHRIFTRIVSTRHSRVLILL